MKKKYIKLIITFIVFLGLSVRVSAGLDKSHNNAFYGLGVDIVSSDCLSSVPSNPTVESQARLYTLQCLHCSGNSATYDGCGGYDHGSFDSGWTHTPLGTFHEECKRPVVYYRTQKDAKQSFYNRCDTIVDQVQSHCTKVHGSGCATCSKKCEPYRCNPHGCNCDEYGCKDTCYDICYRRLYGYKCNGVDAGGNAKTTTCQCGGCSACYKLSSAWKKAIQGGGNWRSPATREVVDWVAGFVGDAVNASCDTQYRVTYSIDYCNSSAVKTTNNVCQKQFKIKPKGSNQVYDAYCVNPDYKTSTGIVWDQLFDATTCATSRSTRNCGYANILIEGYLRKEMGKYSGMDWYSIISYALQFWGAHSGEAGYNGSGFSPESSLVASSQSAVVSFPQMPTRTSQSVGFGIVMETTDYSIDYHAGKDYYRGYLEFVNQSGGSTGTYRNIFVHTTQNINRYLDVSDIYKVKSYVDVTIQGSGNNKSFKKTPNPVHENGLRAIGCNSSNGYIGFCGTSKLEYLEALYLYANTVQGNPKMQEHLKDLIWLYDSDISIDDLGRNNNPESITASINSETKSLSVTYIMPDKGKNMLCKNGATRGGVPVCCTSSDSECDIIHCPPGDTACSQKRAGVTLATKNGNVVLNNVPKRYDYCTKNGYCYSNISIDGKVDLTGDNAICSDTGFQTKAIFDIQLAILNTKSAVKRYEATASPTDHQSYFLIDFSHDGSGNNNGKLEVILACDGCKHGPSIETGYVIDENTTEAEKLCTQNGTNTSARFDREMNICYIRTKSEDNRGTADTLGNKCINCVVEPNGKCATTNGKVSRMVDESINARKISDPSLNCIVNMSYTTGNGGKTYYDYSEEFGVNTDVCRIYCSDEVNIYLANKKDVYVGMHLKYNIENMVEKAYKLSNNTTNRAAIFDANKNLRYATEGGDNSDTNVNLMLSAIIMQERKCVSKIYYNLGYDSSIDFATKYKVGGTINNWKDLYKALRDKSSDERSRRENLNQLIYDLYNCNLLTPGTINAQSNNGVVQKPVDRENVYNQMIDLYKTKPAEGTKSAEYEDRTAIINNDSLLDHRCGDRACSELSGAEYEGGAAYIPTREISGHKRVGMVTGEPEITYYTTSNADLNETNDLNEAEPIKVFYCDSANCFNKNEEYADDYYSTSSRDAGYSTVGSQVGSTYGNKTDYFKDVKIPTKDYATFTIQLRTDYYNSITYQVEHYTGKVKKYIEDDNAKFVKLDRFIYPISLDAFQDGNCREDDELGHPEEGRCQTKFAFNLKPLIWRKNTLDKFTEYLSSDNGNNYVCSYVSRPEPVRDGIVYRSISLKDPFPNRDQRGIPSNWSTDKGMEAINEIMQSSDSIYRVSKNYLEYKYTFTKQALDYIRDNYNYDRDKYGKGYTDIESLENCKKANPKTYKYGADYNTDDEGTIYVECQSTFLDEIKGYPGVTVHQDNGISPCTQNNNNCID